MLISLAVVQNIEIYCQKMKKAIDQFDKRIQFRYFDENTIYITYTCSDKFAFITKMECLKK